jgi:hypothetical protein
LQASSWTAEWLARDIYKSHFPLFLSSLHTSSYRILSRHPTYSKTYLTPPQLPTMFEDLTSQASSYLKSAQSFIGDTFTNASTSFLNLSTTQQSLVGVGTATLITLGGAYAWHRRCKTSKSAKGSTQTVGTIKNTSHHREPQHPHKIIGDKRTADLIPDTSAQVTQPSDTPPTLQIHLLGERALVGL